MPLRAILGKQTDFTGKSPKENAASDLQYFNKSAPDADGKLKDNSGYGRDFAANNRTGTTAGLFVSPKGEQIHVNINNPAVEKTHLRTINDSSEIKS